MSRRISSKDVRRTLAAEAGLHRLIRPIQERLSSVLAADEVDEEARENKEKVTDPGVPHLVPWIRI